MKTICLPQNFPKERDLKAKIAGFTRRYGVKRLVWYEVFKLITQAMRREHTIKGYPRRWKLNLIEGENPDWEDLHERLNG